MNLHLPFGKSKNDNPELPPLSPKVRNNVVKILFDDEARKKLEEKYGDASAYVIDVIDKAPPEIKLTIAMLYGLKIDLSECTPYMSEAVKFPSPLLDSAASGLIGKTLGEKNLKEALFIYDASPPEQILVAVTIAALMQNKLNSPEIVKNEETVTGRSKIGSLFHAVFGKKKG